MALSDYLVAAGLPQYLGVEEPAILESSVEHFLNLSENITLSLSDEDITKLYSYKVPLIDENENIKEGTLDPEPFKLTEIYNLPFDIQELRTTHKETTEWLWRLNRLVEALQKITGVQSLAIYRTVTLKSYDGLVKLAFFGEYSRGVFPMTPEFVGISNIAHVGSTGKAKLIADISAYKGAYYAISSNEKSEICLPIVGEEGEVVGVMNAESWEVGECSLPKVVIPLARACVQLGNSGFASVAEN